MLHIAPRRIINPLPGKSQNIDQFDASALGSTQAQTQLALSLLHGRGRQQDTALAFQWLMQAAGSGDPTVFQILEYAGLDIGRLIDGYKLSRQILTRSTGERFGGENFERIFGDAKRFLSPVLPGEEGVG